MAKTQVTMHCEGFGDYYPAINVKVHGSFGPDVAAVVARFHCTEKAAEHALELAWDSACEEFWTLIVPEAESIFADYGAKCYSAGRSSGWLEMHGLPDVESWSAVLLSKWAKLSRIVQGYIENLTDAESVMGSIDSNEWWKDGAEQYNFIDGKDGKSRCVADMKAEARAAGFGPVVRP